MRCIKLLPRGTIAYSASLSATPAGAFIVLVAATVHQHGLTDCCWRPFISGLILLAIGLLRLGTFIKYIPYPVTVGFAAGIAIIMLASQIKDLLGLTLPGQEPRPIVPKLAALVHAPPTLNVAALSPAIASIATILVLRRLRPHWPGLLIAVALASLAGWIFCSPARWLVRYAVSILRPDIISIIPSATSIGRRICAPKIGVKFSRTTHVVSILASMAP